MHKGVRQSFVIANKSQKDSLYTYIFTHDIFLSELSKGPLHSRLWLVYSSGTFSTNPIAYCRPAANLFSIRTVWQPKLCVERISLTLSKNILRIHIYRLQHMSNGCMGNQPNKLNPDFLLPIPSFLLPFFWLCLH